MNDMPSASSAFPFVSPDDEQHDYPGISPSVIATFSRNENHSLTASEMESSRDLVTYDMSIVPSVHKNANYLRKWRELSLEENKWFNREHQQIPYVKRKSNASNESQHSSNIHDIFQDTFLEHQACIDCLTTFDFSMTNAEQQHQESLPTSDSTQKSSSLFGESVIWIPPSRKDWEDSLAEMNALCTEACWRRSPTLLHKSEIVPPITAAYMMERLFIDDPLRGYQIRHASGGWLQGFIVMTNFTIWHDVFQFDAFHPANGIHFSNCKHVDMGSLAMDLNQQPREGDSSKGGVIFPTIAEISVVGGLGCGEYLIQMALDDISRRGSYDFVILDATESSSTFYEKFGFVRVGAICKHINYNEVVGYRHWTNQNQDCSKFERDGMIPSCLMVRRVARRSPLALGRTCLSCGRYTRPSFLEQLSTYFVPFKPQVRGTGVVHEGTSTNKRSDAPTELVAASNKKMKIVKMTSSSAEKIEFRNIDTNSSVNTPGIKPDIDVSNDPLESYTQTSPSIPNEILGRFFCTTHNRSKQQVVTLVKQTKRTSRHKFANKVVTRENFSTERKFFYVIHVDVKSQMMYLTPLYSQGVNKKSKMITYRAKVLPTSGILSAETCWKNMNILHVPCNEWRIVKSKNINKSSDVDREKWIICE